MLKSASIGGFLLLLSIFAFGALVLPHEPNEQLIDCYKELIFAKKPLEKIPFATDMLVKGEGRKPGILLYSHTGTGFYAFGDEETKAESLKFPLKFKLNTCRRNGEPIGSLISTGPLFAEYNELKFPVGPKVTLLEKVTKGQEKDYRELNCVDVTDETNPDGDYLMKGAIFERIHKVVKGPQQGKAALDKCIESIKNIHGKKNSGLRDAILSRIDVEHERYHFPDDSPGGPRRDEAELKEKGLSNSVPKAIDTK